MRLRKEVGELCETQHTLKEEKVKRVANALLPHSYYVLQYKSLLTSSEMMVMSWQEGLEHRELSLYIKISVCQRIDIT